MDSDLKLEEAEYFLAKLKESALSEPPTEKVEQVEKEFIFSLSAYLSAWRSIPDVLLYDYAEKLMQLSRTIKLNENAFEIAAIASKNELALKFIKCYKNRMEGLKRDPLWKKRNFVVHIGKIGMTKEFRLFVYENLTMGETSQVGFAIPMPISGSMSYMPVKEEIARPNAVVKRAHRFADMPEKEIHSICEESLEKMKILLRECSETITLSQTK